MSDILLALHLVGLMLGAGGGFGSAVTARVAAGRPPEQAAVLRSLGPDLARLSTAGLVVMLLTGLALVFAKYGGFAGLPGLFWVKMLFVLTLTLAAILMQMTYGQIRRGELAAAKRLPVLGPVAGLSSLLAVAFAVFAFH